MRALKTLKSSGIRENLILRSKLGETSKIVTGIFFSPQKEGVVYLLNPKTGLLTRYSLIKSPTDKQPMKINSWYMEPKEKLSERNNRSVQNYRS